MLDMILHIVGNRPQFIKLAPLYRELNRRGYEEKILHTGQHYDENMSDVFFKELEIPEPYKNLGIGSGSHGQMTGIALEKIEKFLMEERPEVIILYGDTNSTLAGGIAAAKLGIPIVHVEAGPRTYVSTNPEEINRKLVDHLSTLCCCPDQESVGNLIKEGLQKEAKFTGDIMYDTFKYCQGKAGEEVLERYGVSRKKYVLMTWHRQENTSTRQEMEQILNFIEDLDDIILYPEHPRTKHILEKFGLDKRLNNIKNLKVVEPVGYIEMVRLASDCKYILCDSGGLSKESCFAGVKCFFMLPVNPWKKLVQDGQIILIKFDDEDNLKMAKKRMKNCAQETELELRAYFGDGNAAYKIVNYMEEANLIVKR